MNSPQTVEAAPAEVIESARRVLGATVDDTALLAALNSVIDGFVAGRSEVRVPALVRIPALVAVGAGADPGSALPLGGVAFLLYLGIDILDDLMDGDVTPYWAPPCAGEALLVGTALTAAVPQAAIARLPLFDGMAADLQRILAEGLAEMAGGQLADLRAFNNASATPEQVERSVAAKSGGMTAMLARLGARFANAPPEAIAAYGEWGAAYGTAEQLRSDCAEVFSDPPGRDLANGAITYLVACFLEAAPEGSRADAWSLVSRASWDCAALTTLRAAFGTSGALAALQMTCEWYRQQGEAALARASPLPLPHQALRSMLRPATRSGGRASHHESAERTTRS